MQSSKNSWMERGSRSSTENFLEVKEDCWDEGRAQETVRRAWSASQPVGYPSQKRSLAYRLSMLHTWGSPSEPSTQTLLSQSLQSAPWPPNYKALALPKYNETSDPRQFLISYEAAITSIGGDDLVLAKSFIVAYWVLLYSFHSIYNNLLIYTSVF